jgi:hypothetical protein
VVFWMDLVEVLRSLGESCQDGVRITDEELHI